MKRLTVTGDKWGTTVEEEVVRVLSEGGIVLHPTETCYGLAVDIFNEEAVAKLYQLKKMNQFKPVSVIVCDCDDAKRWGSVNESAADLMERYWPGPYTFIVNRSGKLPQFFNKSNSKVGMRNPKYESLINIVKKLGHPITTTSANLSGRPETYDTQDFFTQYRSNPMPFEPDLIIDGGFIGVQEPSAVYDCVEDQVLRGEIEV
jgi:tRNA threonylcarbamoyl adenosine modification protein (Sua5/YciO/YrdC/YwlC family)